MKGEEQDAKEIKKKEKTGEGKGKNSTDEGEEQDAKEI